MTRIARVIAPGIPHHVTQRGNRKEPVFFCDGDRRLYLRILKEQSEDFGVRLWAYCLMDNHVHLIAVPEQSESLTKCMAELHRRYTRFVNSRNGWTGHLWQGRFGSFPLEEKHLYAAIRYVERNPVRAGMVEKAEDYPWSSARRHVLGNPDPLLTEHFLREEIRDWAAFLAEVEQPGAGEIFKRHETSGRPLGGESFLVRVEQQLGRDLHKKRVRNGAIN